MAVSNLRLWWLALLNAEGDEDRSRVFHHAPVVSADELAATRLPQSYADTLAHQVARGELTVPAAMNLLHVEIDGGGRA